MSIETVKKQFNIYRRQERATVNSLFQSLPNKLEDDPDTILVWPIANFWNQTIEDACLEAGYHVEFCMNAKGFIISFSDEVKKEIATTKEQSREKKRAKTADQ